MTGYISRLLNIDEPYPDTDVRAAVLPGIVPTAPYSILDTVERSQN